MELTKRVKAAIVGLTITLSIAGLAGGSLLADYQNREGLAQARRVQVVTPTPVTTVTRTAPAKAKRPEPKTNYEPVYIAPTSAAPKPRVTPSTTRPTAKPKATPTKTKTVKPSATAKATPTATATQGTPVPTPSLDWSDHTPPKAGEGTSK